MAEHTAVRSNAPTQLDRLRARLTAWYVLTLFAIVLSLGVGLFAVISRQFSLDLDTSLAAATDEVISAAHVREREGGGRQQVVEVIDELRVPDRELYLLDPAGRPVNPDDAADWIRDAAVRAGRRAEPTKLPVPITSRGVVVEHELRRGRTLRLHAERFRLRGGDTLVAVAVADRVELEDRYADLIVAFGGAAGVALVLVAAGAWLLVRKSTEPIERTIAHMRRFMADAAHELRTPVTVLRSDAEVALQQQRAPEAYVAALRRIEAESARLGRIVDDLLILARADAGERPVERRPVYLDDVLADAAGAAQALAERRGVALTVDDFDEAPVLGDEMLLRQLVMILLDNALKFTPRGGTVRVGVLAEAGRFTLHVRDNGVGIPREQLPLIFDRFYRGDHARTRADRAADAPDGAGLGLSIARWIAREHAADIDVVSEPGQGTTVTVRVPPAPPPDAPR